jgi:hypothetical protein
VSWAKMDDRANEHEKMVEAGADACWLWACGLMYCNRQQKKTGRIPKTIVHKGMLYPGLGEEQAKRLVDVGLWHDADSAYQIHEYHGWNPELRDKRAEAGRQGGKSSGKARREAKTEAKPKQLASADRSKTEATGEANKEATAEQRSSASGGKHEATGEPRAQTRAYAGTDARGIHPTPPHPKETETTTTKTVDQERASGTHPVAAASGSKVPCPKDLTITDDQRATLAMTPGVPDWAIDALTRRFIGNNQADPEDQRPLVTWRKCLWQAIVGDWNNPAKRPRKPEPEPSPDRADDTGGYGRAEDWA